jgi:hypothetical protein
MVIGTLLYMSPEQIDGKTEIDARTDLYSLGVLLYEALSGNLPLPMQGLTLAQAAIMIKEEDPALLGSVDPELKGPLEIIVARALEKDPRHRYATAADLARDLRAYLVQRPIEAQRPSTPRQLQKWTSRHPTLLFRWGLCLPTETQWEYACRAGTTTRYWTGDLAASLDGSDIIAELSHPGAGADNQPDLSKLGDGYPLHAPVHCLRGNPFGLHHMHGNVSEWVADQYGGYWNDEDGERPVSPMTGNEVVVRGGHHAGSEYTLRSSYRIMRQRLGPPGRGSTRSHLGPRIVGRRSDLHRLQSLAGVRRPSLCNGTWESSPGQHT